MDEVEEQLLKIHGGVGGGGSNLNNHSIDAAVAEETNTLQNTDTTDESIAHEGENSFSYEVLQREAGNVKLPSTLWAMHKDPNGRFVAFSRMPIVRTGRLVADKAVVFAESLIPSVFFREMKLKLPIGVSTQPLDSLHQVSAYLHKIHRLAFCTGTGLQDPIRSMKCRIYVDMPSSMRRCTACSSQRQTVAYTEQEKKS